jgi:hypothetical protein
MNVWVDRDELRAVYSIRSEIPDWVYETYPGEIVEMEDGAYRRLKKSLEIAESNYFAVQDEIAKLLVNKDG